MSLTAKSQLQQENLRYAQRLEQKVKERTSQLDQKNKELQETLEHFSSMRSEFIKKAHKAEMHSQIIWLCIYFQLIIVFNLAMFLTGTPEAAAQMPPAKGAFYVFLADFGWIFLGMAVNSLFENKSWMYVYIKGDYWTISFTVMGLILGVWT